MYVYSDVDRGPPYVAEWLNNFRSSVLVWDGISQNLSNVVDTWWENTDLVEALNVFRRVGSF